MLPLLLLYNLLLLAIPSLTNPHPLDSSPPRTHLTPYPARNWPPHVRPAKGVPSNWTPHALPLGILAHPLDPEATGPPLLGVLFHAVIAGTPEPDFPSTTLHAHALVLRFYEREEGGWVKGGRELVHRPRVLGGKWVCVVGERVEGEVVAWEGVGVVDEGAVERYLSVLSGVSVGAEGEKFVQLRKRQGEMRAWVRRALSALWAEKVLGFG
ncbi:MAG: hypothetical protein M1829_003087 [Trizodia sp. TS-e1964]|nr:MAG: hypothetical protein M1829_003087 [Trizodia sp. TS-e1964]